METIVYMAGGFIILFGFVVFFGAPYLPTLKPQIEIALDLLDLKPGQTMIEVGSGDGRVLLAAAKRGWIGVGYELNPILVLFSRWHTRKYRSQVRVIWGNALSKDWPKADGIYIFGIDRIMPKLYKKIAQSTDKPIRLASFTFHLKDHKPEQSNKGVYLYIVPPAA